MNQRILVTGAAGFIGSHVSAMLLARGDEVVGLDNFDPYYAPASKRANAQEVASGPNGRAFRLVEGDIRDRALVEKLFAEGIDAVVHLAALVGVRASLEIPHDYLDVNLTGTLNLLEAARRRPVRNFVLASTSSAYGNTAIQPFIETDPADRPLAPYAASKRAAEMLAHSYHHLYGQDVTVLRFFTVYGPRNRPDMMAYKVLDSIFTGKQIPLYGAGDMFRDWTYVEDIARGVLQAVDRPLGYEIMNLGRGQPVRLLDFIRCMEEFAGRKAHLVPQPKVDSDALATSADIEKARRLLGYSPEVSVREGVGRLWRWYARALSVDEKPAAPARPRPKLGIVDGQR